MVRKRKMRSFQVKTSRGQEYLAREYFIWLSLAVERRREDLAEENHRLEEEDRHRKRLIQDLFSLCRGRRQRAARELAHQGSFILNDLIPFLNHKDWWRRRESIWALGDRADSMPSALAFLIRSLDDPKEEVQFAVLRALGKMGPKGFYSLDHIKRMILDNNRKVKLWAIFAMARITHQIDWALEHLQSVLKDPDLQVRTQAIEILRELGEKGFPLLCETLQDSSELLRWRSARYLGELGLTRPLSPAEIRALRQGLCDQSPKVRLATVRSLAQLGDTAQTLQPYLIEMLSQGTEEVAKEVSSIFRNSVDKILPPLLQWLDEDKNILTAIQVLGHLGEKAGEALPTLEKVRNSFARETNLWVHWAIESIKGKPLAPEWIKGILWNSSVEIRKVAVYFFMNSPKVNSFLLDRVIEKIWDEDEDGEIQKNLISALAQKMVLSSSETPRVLLEILGILQEHPDPLYRKSAAKIVVQRGSEALPLIEKALQKATPRSKVWLAWARWAILGEPYSALEEMGAMIHHPQIEVRQEVLVTLEQMGPFSVYTLLQGLHDEEEKIRLTAVKALGNLAPESSAAIPHLAQILSDSCPEIREASCTALGNMGALASSAAAQLSQALYDEFPHVRKSAVLALGKIGTHAVWIIPSISQALYDEDGEVREYAAVALANLGPLAREVVLVLKTTLEDPLWQVRKAVAHALGKIGPEASSVSQSLISLLEDEREEVQQSAIVALGELRSREGASVLFSMMDHCPVSLVKSIRESLGKIQKG